MNTNDKYIIEKSIKNVIEQKRIPSEDKIRLIIKEEVEKYFKREENKAKEPISVKIIDWINDKKYKRIGWYILMFMLVSIDVFGFKFLTSMSEALANGQVPKNLWSVPVIFLNATIILIVCLAFSIMTYDKMIKDNYKHAKIILLLEITYCCSLFYPSALEWIDRIK